MPAKFSCCFSPSSLKIRIASSLPAATTRSVGHQVVVARQSQNIDGCRDISVTRCPSSAARSTLDLEILAETRRIACCNICILYVYIYTYIFYILYISDYTHIYIYIYILQTHIDTHIICVHVCVCVGIAVVLCPCVTHKASSHNLFQNPDTC